MATYMICDESNIVRLSSISSIYQSKNYILIFTGTETPVKIKIKEQYTIQDIAQIISAAETINKDSTTWEEAVHGFRLVERMEKVFDAAEEKRLLQNPETSEKLDQGIASIDAGEVTPRRRRE